MQAHVHAKNCFCGHTGTTGNVPVTKLQASSFSAVVSRQAVQRPATIAKAAAPVDAPAKVPDAGKISAQAGKPEPLGPSPTKGGVNFAVFSAHATGMKLCLYDSENKPIDELVMQRSGDVWHVEAQGCPKKGVLYGVRVYGEGGWETGHRWDPKRVLLDPYTPLVSGRRKFGVRDEFENFVPKVRCHLQRRELSLSKRPQLQDRTVFAC